MWATVDIWRLRCDFYKKAASIREQIKSTFLVRGEALEGFFVNENTFMETISSYKQPAYYLSCSKRFDLKNFMNFCLGGQLCFHCNFDNLCDASTRAYLLIQSGLLESKYGHIIRIGAFILNSSSNFETEHFILFLII